MLMVLGGLGAMIVGLVAVGSYTTFSASDIPGWFVPVFGLGGLAVTVGGAILLKRLIRRSEMADRHKRSSVLRRLNL
jgi:hypothetical protein